MFFLLGYDLHLLIGGFSCCYNSPVEQDDHKMESPNRKDGG